MMLAATASAGASDPAEDNAAWVDVDLPQPPQTVLAELRDIERFLRLNPHLDIRSFERLPEGQCYRLEALNEMNGLAVSCGLTFQETGAGGFTLRYDSGLKLATEVTAKARGDGAVLHVRERYRQPQNDAQLAEVDRSLTPWGIALRRHFLGQARWGRWRLYRGWRERLWIPMSPRERRITRLIAWATLIEFVVFLVAVPIFLY